MPMVVKGYVSNFLFVSFAQLMKKKKKDKDSRGMICVPILYHILKLVRQFEHYIGLAVPIRLAD